MKAFSSPMLIVDENTSEIEVWRLPEWHISVRQVGPDVAPASTTDENIIAAHIFLRARRLASSRRLVVVAGCSCCSGSSSGGASVGPGALAVAVSLAGNVTGFCGRNKSGLGSAAGAVCRARTWPRRA